jgi:6-phosphogluconolactonase (cycloisomerase 2 family)
MRISTQNWWSRGVAVLACVCAVSGLAAAADQPHYLITNDDVPFVNGVTFYTIGATGKLTLKQQVPTAGGGIGGGYFASNRLAVLNNGTQQCVYASDASTGDITGINVSTLKVGGSASGSDVDFGTTNGVSLALSSQYLYAGFSDSNSIGTFQIQSGCSLTFVNDTFVGGLQAGIIDGMAVHGNTLIATYGDGSMESFDISSGTPVSNSDKQNSTAFIRSQGATYPSGIQITQDGHFAIFGDTATSTTIEVSDISLGKLTKTIVYNLGGAANSSNILLSPDETVLYIGNTQADSISAATFNKTTGKLSTGCVSGKLRGYVSQWAYAGGLALQSATGTGGLIYVAEFGGSSIGVVQMGSNGGQCTLAEVSGSPISDANSPGLLSIGSFPPRSF